MPKRKTSKPRKPSQDQPPQRLAAMAGYGPKRSRHVQANDARLLQLRGASTKQLANILAESLNGEAVISPAYFALGMDSRFRETQPEELRELIATVILERRGANVGGEIRP